MNQTPMLCQVRSSDVRTQVVISRLFKRETYSPETDPDPWNGSTVVWSINLSGHWAVWTVNGFTQRKRKPD